MSKKDVFIPAFEACIETRWIPRALGAKSEEVPECQLCKVAAFQCKDCPLYLLEKTPGDCDQTPFEHFWAAVSESEHEQAAWDEVWFLVGAMREWEEAINAD